MKYSGGLAFQITSLLLKNLKNLGGPVVFVLKVHEILFTSRFTCFFSYSGTDKREKCKKYIFHKRYIYFKI